MKTALIPLTALLLAPLAAVGHEERLPMALPQFKSIHAPSSAAPIRTASTNLRNFLKARGVELPVVTDANGNKTSAAGTIVLGTTADTPAFKRWAKEGRLSLTASAPARDAYEIRVVDGCVVLNGANARAVLYAAFELEDVIAQHGGVPENFVSRAKPTLNHRLLHPRAVRGNFHGYRQSDFEFIARCGGNVAHLTHDWMKEKTLFSYVLSAAFPQAADAKTLERNRASLRKYLDWCQLYGLSGAMWLCEVPCQGGPWTPEPVRKAFLDHFPAECLSDTGTYQGKLPCLAHPQVEQEYRRMTRQFLTDFPGISMFLIFTLDSNGELCDPATCPRHQGVSKLTQYNRLLALMAEEGRKVRPDFQVFSVGWSWRFRGDADYLPHQAALPAGAGLTMPPDGEAWSFDRKTTDFLLKARSLTREKGQTFLGYDIFFWGDDTVFGPIKDSKLPPGLGITKLYDFPLGVAAKLRRWQQLGADGFFDQWGTMGESIQTNAVALRELVFHPENQNPDQLDRWAQNLATRRYGSAAAPHLLAAWKEIEAAQQLQSDHTYYWHHLRPAWSAPVLQCPLTLEALKAAELTHNGRSSAEPSKPHSAHDYSPYRDDVSCARALAPALRDAAGHFGKALVHLQTAASQMPSDAHSALDHWYQPEAGAPERLTPRQALDEQIIAVRLQEQCQLRMSRFFQAWALVKTLPPIGKPEYQAAKKTLEQLQAEDKALPQMEQPLWVGVTDLSKNANIPFIDAEHRIIDECTAGEYQFTLGADIVFHDGEFIAQWANSRLEENDADTVVRGRRSKDAVAWTEREVIAPGFEGPGYHSHGVFHSYEGQLWSFNAQHRQQTARNGYFQGLRTDAFLRQPQSNKWVIQEITGLDAFWPLCKPVRLANGKWIMAGAKNAAKTVLAAVAICEDNRMTRWRQVVIPHPSDLAPDQIWGETTVTVEGSRVLAIVRNRKKDGTGFWYSISSDHGETWPELRESNIPQGGGRPVLGRLPDGRHFLVANMRSRNTLVLSLTKPGTFQFDRMFRLLDKPSPPVRMPPAGAKRSQWGYPSAIEHDGRLYVVYSATKEATGLTVVDLAKTVH